MFGAQKRERYGVSWVESRPIFSPGTRGFTSTGVTVLAGPRRHRDGMRDDPDRRPESVAPGRGSGLYRSDRGPETGRSSEVTAHVMRDSTVREAQGVLEYGYFRIHRGHLHLRNKVRPRGVRGEVKGSGVSQIRVFTIQKLENRCGTGVLKTTTTITLRRH